MAAIVWEGGRPARGALAETILRLRAAATLDLLSALLAVPELSPVILATNRPELAAAAGRLGAEVAPTAPAIHFGQELSRLVAACGRSAVICLGGAAAPLFTDAHWRWIVSQLTDAAPCVVVNNPQSADVVAWSPASALASIAPPAADNFLGYLLQCEAGLPRILIPNSAATHFDLDTPTDYLVLAESGRAGLRLAAALAELDWDRTAVRRMAAVVRQDLGEVALVGRVGTAVVDFCNAHLRLRLRLFSEERGMKALGREERGLVQSFIARVLAELGPERFFAELGAVCSGIIMDSRVVFAHGGRRVSARDRFLSDLGLAADIQDPQVRALTRAARSAPCPVLLGGHGVVSGSLWLLAEQALAARLTEPGAAVVPAIAR